ncbi:NAD-binding protein [Calocera viscosa TUFC12733]|uniref:NAD-binding protein n=1 Tax=Calocera viscosa (strain TUFC12733) TaxID=1330018 RepID=A0A167PTY9_CALVF|nr:NAD-binding protein [Calocera viscosa TUFC12733]
MSEFTSFVVAGAGNLGVFIIQELVKLKKQGKIASVVVFTRSNDSHEKILRLGAKPINVNYSNPDQLAHALKGVHCVISTLAVSAVEFEKEIARACKAMEVRLFVPSEFGLPKIDHFGSRKDEVKRYIKEIKQPYAIFYTGAFSDLIFTPYAGFNWDDGKVRIGGSGDQPASFTARPDIARYLAYVLTELSAEELENKIFLIEGERISFNAIFSGWEARTGRTLQITRIPRSELEKESPANFGAHLFLEIDNGNGTVGAPEETNLYYPEWKPKKALEVLLG